MNIDKIKGKIKSMLDGIKWTNELKHKLGYGEYIYVK